MLKSKKARIWAKENWQSLLVAVGQIKELAKESRLRAGKGKVIVCGTLRVVVTAAQQDKCVVDRTERETNELLQELVIQQRKKWNRKKTKQQQTEITVKSLQSQLHSAFVKEQDLWLELAELQQEDLESGCGFSSMPKDQDLIDREVTCHYPWGESKITLYRQYCSSNSTTY